MGIECLRIHKTLGRTPKCRPLEPELPSCDGGKLEGVSWYGNLPTLPFHNETAKPNQREVMLAKLSNPDRAGNGTAIFQSSAKFTPLTHRTIPIPKIVGETGPEKRPPESAHLVKASEPSSLGFRDLVMAGCRSALREPLQHAAGSPQTLTLSNGHEIPSVDYEL